MKNLHCIRRIEDDAYIFSMARGFPGRIIASRTARKGDCSGKNVFDLLKIPKSEYDFLNDELCEGGTSALVLASGADVARAVIVFRFFSYDSSLLLAIAPDCDAGVISRLAHGGELGDTKLSPALQRLAEEAPCDRKTENRICEYMAVSYGCVDVLAAICRPGLRPEVDDIRFAANAAGMMMGVRVDVNVTYLPERYAESGARIFAGELCVSAMLTFALIARKCSKGREMLFEIISEGENLFLRLSFDMYGEQECRRELERLSMIVKGHRELYFDFGEKEGIVWLESWPFYYDVGMAEIKRPDPFVKLKLPRMSFDKTRDKEYGR